MSLINTKEELLNKRRQSIGKNISLSYNEPLMIVQGEGQYLYDEAGNRFLDCVNNVCHVGHCHPKVVEAATRQMSILNTNTRYLNELLTNYAEHLIATLPSPLEVCFFVCSGSEANELALRLARTHTKRNDILVMDHGYHGNTSTLINISPYKFNGSGGKGRPDWVQVLPMPDPIRDKEIPVLPQITINPAAFIGESLPSCGGQIILPTGYLEEIYNTVRQIGGVCIADEVQVGLGRVGSHFWGFETQNVIPDIVTMGKPLGNGHPIGAVVTTREIADSFCNGMEYFNSFGGNPVSCAIGLTVLKIIEEEQLQTHAFLTGNYLKHKLLELQKKHTIIGDVRGLGLFLGIELVTDRITKKPAKDIAKKIVNQMKDRRILLSTDGPYENVIKIKPPMLFTQENSLFLVETLDELLLEIN